MAQRDRRAAAWQLNEDEAAGAGVAKPPTSSPSKMWPCFRGLRSKRAIAVNIEIMRAFVECAAWQLPILHSRSGSESLSKRPLRGPDSTTGRWIRSSTPAKGGD